ncbi:hypothetical protein LAZ67_6003354 [Cordylochernes scorpioides]|uniref:Transposable element Tc1 transposase n=1 Tax=Cordylochernes scorpioides TaxID=51811 RepID=A0ABY6KNQ1_9ARAC|nr:hypothetical protein LAZ67_6003354 [Cordylochernes scorpioides]
MNLGKDAQNVQKITDLIKENPRTTLLELEQDTGISKTTIGRIVTKDLKLKKTPAKFIPRFLTNEQKLCRLATCENMLEMTRTDPEWKDKIITGDETWVYDYDPETKRQYAEWRGQVNEENIAAVKKLLETDRNITYHQIEECLDSPESAIHSILHDHLKEGTTDRRVRSHPPQCTTSRADRQIVRMAGTYRSVTSLTVAQHIQSVTRHSESMHTIRRRLQQSGLTARRPLLRLPLTQNHRRLRRQWCDERRMWMAEWNEIVFTDESRFCLQHHDGRIRVWRRRGERMLSSCVMHRHTGPVPGIMVWGGIGYLSRTPLVGNAGNLNSQRCISEVLKPFVLPYLQGLPTAIFQQDNARLHVARIVQRFFVNRQIDLLPWPCRSPDLSPIENMWSMVAQRLTQITSPATTLVQLCQRVEASWSAVPQEHI